ncbi:hypothetical protein Hhel01_01857 [Haloferula helveola]
MGPATEEEMDVLYEKACSRTTFKIGGLMTTRNDPPGFIAFEIQRDVEDEFRRELQAALEGYKRAQQSGGGSTPITGRVESKSPDAAGSD